MRHLAHASVHYAPAHGLRCISPPGNACYVCLTKAASKLDEGAIRELMASRCALKGVAGPARRRLTHSRVRAGLGGWMLN